MMHPLTCACFALHAAPLQLVTECDGLRIITNDSCQFLQVSASATVS